MQSQSKDPDESWQECSSGKYASMVEVGFLIYRNNFETAAMTSFLRRKHLPPGE